MTDDVDGPGSEPSGDDVVEDPFDELDGQSEDVLFGESKDGPPRREDPTTGTDDADPPRGGGGDRSPTASRDPFDELEGSPGDEDDLGDAFERMDVGGVQSDVWESLDEVAGDAPGSGGAPGGGPGASEPFGTAADAVEHVVDKRSYCQQCPHFTAPPEAACTHEGTAIVEVIGFDEFRVRNCPMVDDDDPAFDTDPRK
ncbi:hypothetical protein [Halorubrum trueperi]|uniref:DUF8135 domain-containing protein n=1 Tax=Halorubrum trueperi TaxID=2004704 RepID=A0ABD5UT68_9EURY